MGQFHLEFSLPGLGPLGKNVKDQLGPIDDFEVDLVSDGTDLRGIELLVENKQCGTFLEGCNDKAFQFSRSHQKSAVYFPAILQETADGLDAA